MLMWQASPQLNHLPNCATVKIRVMEMPSMRFGSQAWLSSHLSPMEQLGRADLLTQPGPQCTKDGVRWVR